ncbi:MAG: hypothetical protein NDI60_04075 [Elusimicrobiales bacterium]|nr:hypothetical protein [Elusimicrobiales bacterium]
MSDGDSVFSFLKPQAVPAPAPAPAAAPRVPDNVTAKIAELEAKLKALEAKAGQVGAMPPPPPPPGQPAAHRADLEAQQSRVDQLEKTVLELRRALDNSIKDRLAEKENFSVSAERLGGELAVLRARVEAAEEISRDVSRSETDGSLYARFSEKVDTQLIAGLKSRLAALESVFDTVSRKAHAAGETSSGNSRRLDKLDERAARLEYLETRVEAADRKLERVYELDAAVQALKAGVEDAGAKAAAAVSAVAAAGAEQERSRSGFESLSHQVKHLSALFNYFRTELSFLLPKEREKAGRDR